MSLLASIQTKKSSLNTVSEVRDCSAPKFFKEQTKEEVIEYQREILSVNIEEWENCLSKPFQDGCEYKDLVTFPTWYLPITKKEAQSVILTIAEKNNVPHSDFDNYDQLIHNNPDFRETVSTLQNRLQQKIDEILSNSNNYSAVFVKTSSRSPKDAPALDQRLRTIYRDYITSHFSPPFTTNHKITALLWAGVQMLKVKSAEEAMNLLCSSIRILQDFNLALNAMESENNWNENIIIRSWVDIDVDMEFRAFVKNRKMTALSQYNESAYFPRLCSFKEEIERKILHFFENSVLSLLPNSFQDFIIDFAITGDLERDPKLWVIELNPFLETTSSILFSWKNERDVLENGPFEFRVRTKVPSGDKANLAVDWRRIIEEEKFEIPKNSYT